MNVPAALSFEIAQTSRGFTLGVMFPKTRARHYPDTLAICLGATRHWDIEAEGVLYHCAVFDSSPEQMARALAVLNNANTITGARFYARGVALVDTFELHATLKCFIQSQACSDVRAHCIKVMRNPADRLDYFIPCRRIAERSPRFPMDRAHPAAARDQIQAKAVELGCDWCPNFNVDLFKPAPIPDGRLTQSRPVTLSDLADGGEIDVPGDAET